MSVETPVSQNISAINEKLAYDALSPKFHMPNFDNYRDHDSYHGLNNNFSKEINLSPLDVNFQNTQIFTVPINVLPPPPHKIVHYQNNIILKKLDSKYGGKNKDIRSDVRAVSPKGYESDESGRSSLYSKCIQQANKTSDKSNKPNPKTDGKNGKNDQFSTGKYNCHSPKVYQPNYYDQPSGNTNLRNKRYYTNSSLRSKQNTYKNYSVDNITRRVYGLMERFKSRAYLMRIDPNPEMLLNGGSSDHLSQAIWDVFLSKAQKESTYINKLETWKTIFLSIKNCLDSYGLFIVGSTMSGFGLETSDIDMCLLTKPFVNDPRIDALTHLDHVRNLLVNDGIVKDVELIVAKVPILKFKDLATGFEIDLNCNNGIGIHNTHLLHCYARLDWRVRAMVVIVKVWAQANNINDAKNMTISSYSLALMVINYLQCGVTPPVLPCLHGLVPEIFNSSVETSTDVQEDIDFIRDFKSDNINCIGDLLIGFLNYYSHFNFAEFAISVRTGSRLPIDECRYQKSPKNDVNQWKYLCIEEPFNLSNTARSVFDVDKFKFIKDVFMYSYCELSRTKNLNMILPVHFPANQR
ncbi:poly(A) RNA polymerase gld-2 homolog A-like [Coccinella septempunctata]|uniref:poly(A) RNA polymerase gld-2 homolog A-like n=1 Tax=Coccinella septempunctata TaxID=41139 RepID=UPI001D088B54|nr:poly(A) RNA polymerase gld-2 homolog A-like [Coccinella septempunctata]